jgi:hypothetical protein
MSDQQAYEDEKLKDYIDSRRHQLSVIVATLHWKGWDDCITSWSANASLPFTQRTFANMPLLEAYQRGFEESHEPILGYIHDDVVCYERGWDERVLKEFEDPAVGLVGFGGALGHGDPEMYKKPYELSQLARRHFLSNMREAEAHGERFTGECDVAVLDGFALFVRRKVLLRAGHWNGDPFNAGYYGWPVGNPIGYIGYDYWLSCEARRQSYRIRLVGVACDHLGGKSTGMTPPGFDAKFEEAHRYIYDTCRDVLPYEVA